jgi:N-dimethylarginine dimethylaminohydrolase
MNPDNHALNLLTEGGATPEDALWILDDLKHVINYTEDHLGEQEMVNELTKHWQRNQSTDNEYGFPNWEQYQSLLNHLGIDLERMQQELNDTIQHDDY